MKQCFGRFPSKKISQGISFFEFSFFATHSGALRTFLWTPCKKKSPLLYCGDFSKADNDRVRNCHLLDRYSALVPEARDCVCFTWNCYSMLQLVRCVLNNKGKEKKMSLGWQNLPDCS